MNKIKNQYINLLAKSDNIAHTKPILDLISIAAMKTYQERIQGNQVIVSIRLSFMPYDIANMNRLLNLVRGLVSFIKYNRHDEVTLITRYTIDDYECIIDDFYNNQTDSIGG